MTAMPPRRPLLFARGGALVFEFTGAIAGGALIGWFLDGKLGTDPYGMIVCILLGAGGGFMRLLQSLRRFEQVDRERER